MFKCRQIQCPVCDHAFMWIEYADLPPSYNMYKRNDVEEELRSTHCPKCHCEMIVPDNSRVGISVNDENVELIGTVRGI